MKNKKMMKRILAAAISLIMVMGMLPLSVFAAGSDAEVKSSLSDLMSVKDKPEQYDKAGDPYGKDGVFNLAPQHELLKIFLGGSSDDTENDIIITENITTGDTTVNDKSNAGSVVKKIDGWLHKWSYMQAVAFDGRGTGRDTHLAIIGYDPGSKEIRLMVYDIVNQTYAKSYKYVAKASWIAEEDGDTVMHFNASNFLSITAGDYDGDGVDTIVVYAAADYDKNSGVDKSTLTEFFYHNDDRTIYKQADSNSLLHYSYFNTEEGKAAAKNQDGGSKLGADLATGDFDGDGKDDLAVVSYIGMGAWIGDSGLFTPYLGIAMGCGKGNAQIINRTSNNAERNLFDSMNNGSDVIMFAPSVAAGDVDGDGLDEVFVAGYGGEVSGSSPRYVWSEPGAITAAYFDISVQGGKTTRSCAMYERFVYGESDIINEMTEDSICQKHIIHTTKYYL